MNQLINRGIDSQLPRSYYYSDIRDMHHRFNYPSINHLEVYWQYYVSQRVVEEVKWYSNLIIWIKMLFEESSSDQVDHEY